MRFTKKVTGNKPKKRRLWLSILILVVGVALGYYIWLFFSLQGKFFLERVNIPPDPLTGIVDYRFVVKTLDGFRMQTYDFGRFYGDKYHKDNNDRAFSPNHELAVEIVSRDIQTGQTMLAIRGSTFDNSPVLSLVSYANRKFSSIPYYNGSRHREIYFVAQKVLLKNLDDDPELEVILGILLTSEDGSSQAWDKTRLDYNAEKQAYLQTSTTHEQSLE